MSFTSTSSQTLFQAIILCNLKENWWTNFKKIGKNLISCLFGPNLDHFFFFFFWWVLLLLDVSHCHELLLSLAYSTFRMQTMRKETGGYYCKPLYVKYYIYIVCILHVFPWFQFFKCGNFKSTIGMGNAIFVTHALEIFYWV